MKFDPFRFMLMLITAVYIAGYLLDWLGVFQPHIEITALDFHVLLVLGWLLWRDGKPRQGEQKEGRRGEHCRCGKISDD